MVARTRPEGEMLVIFSRNGEPDDVRLVPNPERAAIVAVLMIAGRNALHPGDQLIVRQYDDAS